jgi:hypothetical protein
MTPTNRWLAAVAGVCLLWTAPLGADLKYKMRIEAQRSSVPASAPAHPMLTVIGGIVVDAMAPAGGLEITVAMSERGSRVEYNKAYTVVPAGGVTLMRPDGNMIVLDPSNRTYWRMARPEVGAGMPTPHVMLRRTGEFEVLAGVRSERAALEIRVPLPIPADQLPPGVPAEVMLEGEAWVADQFKEYSALSASVTGMASLGLDTLAAEGLPMWTVLRGEIFGDRQVESRVTDISEAELPASAFEIPEGYTEVAPPAVFAGMTR